MLRLFLVNAVVSLGLFAAACASQVGVEAYFANRDVIELAVMVIIAPVIMTAFLWHAFGVIQVDEELILHAGPSLVMKMLALFFMGTIPTVAVVASALAGHSGIHLAFVLDACIAVVVLSHWMIALHRVLDDGTGHRQG